MKVFVLAKNWASLVLDTKETQEAEYKLFVSVWANSWAWLLVLISPFFQSEDNITRWVLIIYIYIGNTKSPDISTENMFPNVVCLILKPWSCKRISHVITYNNYYYSVLIFNACIRVKYHCWYWKGIKKCNLHLVFIF